MVVLEAFQNLEGVLDVVDMHSIGQTFNVAGVSINVDVVKLGEWGFPMSMTLVTNSLLPIEGKRLDEVEGEICLAVLMMHLVEMLFQQDLTLIGSGSKQLIVAVGGISQSGGNHFPPKKDLTGHLLEGTLMTTTFMTTVHMG